MNDIELAKEMAAAVEARNQMTDMVCKIICGHTGKDKCLERSIIGVIRAAHEVGCEKALHYLDISAHHTGTKGKPTEENLMMYFYGIMRQQRGGAK